MASKQQRWHSKQVSSGKCEICGDPTEIAPNGQRKGKHRRRCDKHLRMDADRNKATAGKLAGKCRHRTRNGFCLKKTEKARRGFKRKCAKHEK